MSAVGLIPPQKGKLFISSHAEYRRDDFIFPRTQSCAIRDLPWDRSPPPFRPWDRLVYASAACLAVTGLVFAVWL
jgi:hypothetical protein